MNKRGKTKIIYEDPNQDPHRIIARPSSVKLHDDEKFISLEFSPDNAKPGLKNFFLIPQYGN